MEKRGFARIKRKNSKEDAEMLCKVCQKEFTPNKYRPSQKVCSNPECQKIRQIENMKEWRIKNSGYFKSNSTEAVWQEDRRKKCNEWRKNHQGHLQEYRKSHRHCHRQYMQEYMRKYRLKF